MSEMDPYKAYAEDAILSSGPVGLVIALYEGAIDSCIVARNCLATGDIAGRAKAINKIVNILTELLRTLNDEKGGEISQNLRRLYAYIQGRVTDAHIHQDASPLTEAEKLLSTILEGWKGIKTTNSIPSAANASLVVPRHIESIAGVQEDYANAATEYSSYMPEAGEYTTCSAYSF